MDTPITHAAIYVMDKDGNSQCHNYRLGEGPCGRHVSALSYTLLPCGGVRIAQYSDAIPGHGLLYDAIPGELKHFIYPATVMTGQATITLE